MAEYIEREKLPQKKNRDFFLDDDFTAGWNACLNNIKNIPAADVRPVVKAIWKHVQWVVDEEWQEGGYWISRCSNCSMPYNTETPFCPHCGADMREPPKEELA